MRLPVGALIASAFVLLLAPAASADSFSLGVAAGEVSPNSAILWGHADQAGETRVEVATDAASRTSSAASRSRRRPQTT